MSPPSRRQDKFQTDEDIFEVNNGCICCTVRVDLITILDKISKRHKDPASSLKLDHIVIETTGLADPAPVAQTFFVDENVKVSRGQSGRGAELAAPLIP